jgi:hypothetical protein
MQAAGQIRQARESGKITLIQLPLAAPCVGWSPGGRRLAKLQALSP